MDSSTEKQSAELQAVLKAARENENRWMEMSAEFSNDAKRIEQWRVTARLRRQEVKRIEALLASRMGPLKMPPSACDLTDEVKDRLGETA
jgi:hypothetical protein